MQKYQTLLPDLTKEGVYELNIDVDGQTFSRSYRQQITLRQDFGAEIRERFEDGKLDYVLTVNAYRDSVDFDKTQVVATIITPQKRRIVRPLSFTEMDTWETKVMPNEEGVYRAEVTVNGIDLNGSSFKSTIDPVTLSYSVEGGLTKDETPFVEPSPEPSPEPETIVEEAEELVEAEPAKEDAVADPAQDDAGLPSWITYAVLGVGNLLLILVGFFAYKKIMGGPKDDVLEELEEGAKEEPVNAVEETVDDDDLEEEPPMEDLDPDGGEVESVEMDALDEVESVAPPVENIIDEDVPDLDPEDNEPEAETAMDAVEEEIDDLDAMAMEVVEEAENAAGEEDDEDMVSAMLKAQGLDLAEDELDEAISSLIDDLEDDDEEETDK